MIASAWNSELHEYLNFILPFIYIYIHIYTYIYIYIYIYIYTPQDINSISVYDATIVSQRERNALICFNEKV